MAANNMRYLMRSPDGKEYGPVDQETLLKWGESGRITDACLIRNVVMKQWHPARKIDFVAHLVVAEEKHKGKKDAEVDALQNNPRGHSLVHSGPFKYVAAGGVIRLVAWLVDLVVLAVLAGALIAGACAAVVASVLPGPPAFALATVLAVAAVICYYTLTMGLNAQTLGQWFAGLMVVRGEGGPVLLGRAFFYTLCHFAFFWTTPLFMLIIPRRRALQDLLCDLRVVRITVRDIS